MQPRARFDHFPRRLHACAMARDARQVPPLGPAAVAVHDHGEVVWEPLRIELFEKLRFFTARRLQEIAGFHGKWLRESPLAKLSQAFTIRNREDT
jgi:hypothetical protein